MMGALQRHFEPDGTQGESHSQGSHHVADDVMNKLVYEYIADDEVLEVLPSKSDVCSPPHVVYDELVMHVYDTKSITNEPAGQTGTEANFEHACNSMHAAAEANNELFDWTALDDTEQASTPQPSGISSEPARDHGGIKLGAGHTWFLQYIYIYIYV